MNWSRLAITDFNGTPRVMTLLRKKKLNPENVPEGLFSLKDNFGTSVLDVCIERFKEPFINNRGQTVPRIFSLVSKTYCKLPLYFSSISEILIITKENGWTVAHEMAFQGFLSKHVITEDILKLQDKRGCSVAYCAAWYDAFPDWAKRRKDILLLGNGKGDYVAHVLARRGELPVEMMTEDMLNLKDSDGCTLAYHAAWHDSFPEWAKRNRDILLLGNGQGDYVAHVLVQSGRLLVESMTEEILKLKDRNGCTLAYHAAWYDSFPEWAKRRKDILILGNSRKDYVAHVLARNGKLPEKSMTPDILKLKDSDGRTVLSVIISERYLSPEILMLPWNKNTRVFEYLLSEKFLNQVCNEQDRKYVKEQLSVLTDLIQKKCSRN